LELGNSSFFFRDSTIHSFYGFVPKKLKKIKIAFYFENGDAKEEK